MIVSGEERRVSAIYKGVMGSWSTCGSGKSLLTATHQGVGSGHTALERRHSEGVYTLTGLENL